MIAKGIIEMHGGQISISSKRGQGTRVEFYVTGLKKSEESDNAQNPAA